jgi:hypothetical protein
VKKRTPESCGAATADDNSEAKAKHDLPPDVDTIAAKRPAAF